MPLLTPIRPDLGWLNASPEKLKTAWGLITVVIALTWWIYIQYISNRIQVVKTNLYLPIFGFIVWSFITLFWVEDGYLATIMLAQFSSSALIFILIVNTFKDYKLVELIPKVLVISMLIVAIIGLMQYYFPNNYFIQNIFSQAAKPSATFGNKNMASHFIVMTLPLSIVLLIMSKINSRIIFYSITTIFGFWFLIYAVARQAYVAMAIELFVLILFFALDYYKNKDQSLWVNHANPKTKVFAMLSVVLSLILVSNFSTEGSFTGGSSKIEFVKKIDVEGVSSRFPAWINTIEMIKEHPVSGVGVGQWQESYPLYYDRKMKDTFFNEKVHLDRLHNDYLEILADVGLVGMALLIWIVYLVVIKVWRILSDHQHQNRLLILGISMGLIGFSAIAMVSFPIRVYLPAFLVMVYLAIIVLTSPLMINSIEFKQNYQKKLTFAGLVLTGMLTIFITNYSYRWIMAEYYFHNSIGLGMIERYTLSLKSSLKSLEYNNWSPNFYLRTAENLIKMGKDKIAIPYLKKTIDISPFNTRALLALSQIYIKDPTPENLNMERKILEFILSFDPKNVNALAYLTKHLAQGDRGKDATVVYQRLKNSFEYFKDRSNFGPYHNNVGFVAVSVGQYNYAQYVYLDAIRRFPTAENYYKLAIVEFDFLKNQEKGIEYYKKVLKLDPNIDKNKEIQALIENYEYSVQQ